MAGGHGGEAGFGNGSCPSPVECCIFWVLCFFLFFHMNCEESYGCSIWNWALSFQLRMAQRHLVIIFLDQNVCIRSWQAISCPSALHVARSYPSGTASVGSFYHFSKGYPNPPDSILASLKELQLKYECPPAFLQLGVAVTQLTKGMQAEIMCAAPALSSMDCAHSSLYLPPYCCLSLDMLSSRSVLLLV